MANWGSGAGYAVPNYLPDSTTTTDMTNPDAFGGYGQYALTPNDVRQSIGAEYSGTFGSSPGTIQSSTPGLLSNNQMAQSSSINTSGLSGLDSGGGTLGAIGGAVGTAANIYNNSSDNTGSSVLSGAASGAAAGTMIMPGIGTAIGAVVGGIIGFFGSKSKKNQEKKAFQQQEQLAILPYQQQQANWLQKEGLEQKAMSNYVSGYTPGGYKYNNSLLGSAPQTGFGTPTAGQSLPNFNVAPPSAVPGKGSPSLGIQGNSISNNGVNTSGGLVAPQGQLPQPAKLTAVAPTYTKDKAQNTANINNYAANYQAMLNQQNQQAAADAINPYAAFYGSVG